MSVHRNRVGGWDVRYRLNGRQRSKSFTKEREAEAKAFDKAMTEIREQAKVKAAIDEARKLVGG